MGHDIETKTGDLISLSVVRKVLLEGDTELAGSDGSDRAGREWRGEGTHLPSTAVREHLALQTYLT